MKTLYFFILLLVALSAKGQSYVLNKQLINQDKSDFLGCKKEVFDYEESVSFSLDNNDLAASFDEMKEEKPKNREYFEGLKDSLINDSLNSKLMFEIGNYYHRISDKNNSEKYYRESLKNIAVKFFEYDSAYFYSTRGLLKFKLGMQGFTEDAEKALYLKPNEEELLNLYMMFLISNNDFQKAQAFATNRLNNNAPYPEFTILCLVITNGLQHIIESMTIDASAKKKTSQKHFKELIDWSYIKIYYENLDNKQVALKFENLKFFFNLALKISLFKKNEKEKILLEFSNAEKKQIKKLERWIFSSLKHKTLNEYTAYKCLGFLSFFCLEEEQAAITYYQKAIEVFSMNKPKFMFNPNEAYDNLLFIYKYLGKNRDYENLLLKKITDPKIKSISDYINLSKFYLLEENIKKAKFYLEEAERINPEHFDIYRLKAHLSYVTGTEIILEGFYINKASRLAKTNDDNYRLYLQCAIYDMFNNKNNKAFNKLSIIKRNREDCETCDRLLSTYFVIKN